VYPVKSLADARLDYASLPRWSFLFILKFLLGDWTDSPLQLLMVADKLAEYLPPGEDVAVRAMLTHR
jgi:hypothetical protein